MLRTLAIGFMGLILLLNSYAPAPAQESDSPAAPTARFDAAPNTAPANSVMAPTEPTPALAPATQPIEPTTTLPVHADQPPHATEQLIDYTSLLYVFMLATFIGLGVILRVSRLLHTPLMSLTNAISAIAVVGSIIVTGDPHHPTSIRILGAIALFASMTNIVSGFLITDRMLKMFKTPGQGGKR